MNAQLRIVSACRNSLTKKASKSAVHKTRVAIRRARVAISMLGSRPRLKHISHDLRKLGGLLGDVRDLDVAIENAAVFSIDPKKLIRMRKRAARKLWQAVNVKRRMSFTKRIAKIGYLRSEPSTEGLGIILSQAVLSLEKQASRKRRGERGLHRLRADLKLARYLLEACDKPVQVMKPLQTLLGQSHDIEVLRDLVGKHSGMMSSRKSFGGKAQPLIRPTLRYAIREIKKLATLMH